MTHTIAVLDYGFGNLHSVSRAIARVGGRALVTRDAGESRARRRPRDPGRRALRRVHARDLPARAGSARSRTSARAAGRSSASASACRCSSRGATRTRTRASGVLPGHGRAPRRRREGAPHGMEHGRVDRRQHPYVDGLARRHALLLRALVRARPVTDATPWATTTTGGRSPPRSRATTCSPRSSTRRSPAMPACTLYECVREVARMIVIPAIDLRGGRAVRLVQGDPERRDAVRGRPGRGRGALPGGGRPPPARGRPRRRARRRATTASGGRDLPGGRRCPCRSAGACGRTDDIDALLELGAARAILGTAAATRPGVRPAGGRGARRGDRRRGRRAGRPRDGARAGRRRARRSRRRSPRSTTRARLDTWSPRSRATARSRAPTCRSTKTC